MFLVVGINVFKKCGALKKEAAKKEVLLSEKKWDWQAEKLQSWFREIYLNALHSTWTGRKPSNLIRPAIVRNAQWHQPDYELQENVALIYVYF